MTTTLTLRVVDGRFAVCRLSSKTPIPEWATAGPFFSATRTADELSIVCADDERIPATVHCERNWRMLRVAGTQAFSLTGVLSSVLEPLAAAGISIFAISTFDTDYVLVKSDCLVSAIAGLKAAGHAVEEQ
jgi:hypothetical protein